MSNINDLVESLKFAMLWWMGESDSLRSTAKEVESELRELATRASGEDSDAFSVAADLVRDKFGRATKSDKPQQS